MVAAHDKPFTCPDMREDRLGSQGLTQRWQAYEKSSLQSPFLIDPLCSPKHHGLESNPLPQGPSEDILDAHYHSSQEGEFRQKQDL